VSSVNTSELAFSNMSLNRESAKRKHANWLAKQLSDSNSVFIPIWRGNYLFANDVLVEVKQSDVNQTKFLSYAMETLFLGVDKTKSVFILDLSSLSKEKLQELFKRNFSLTIDIIEFRSSLHLINVKDVATLAYGKALSYWHVHHQYCGFCGHKSHAHEGGHMRKCLDENCHRESFPRTDPVVIMLVEHQPEQGPAKCLLAQHNSISSQVVSTLAGFVDPGESLEEAVAREVKEEAGIVADKVTYMASQPWAFPSSLMIGFFANAQKATLNIDHDEIADANWYTAKEIRTFGEWGDGSDSLQLPRKESISRYLIETWLAKQP